MRPVLNARPAAPADPPRRTARALGVVVLVAAALAGCASPDPEPEVTLPSAGTPTPTATETETEDTGYDAEDEAAVRDLWDQYWAALVASLNGPDPDPALWQGFASEEVIAERTTLAESYVEFGISFTGEPVVDEPTVEWGEGSALLVGCVDETDWVGMQAGEPLPPRPYEVHPFALTVLEEGDGWVVAKGDEKPSGVTC